MDRGEVGNTQTLIPGTDFNAHLPMSQKSIDPHDIGWVDRSLSNHDDDMDDEFSVKEIPDNRKPAFRTYGQAEVDEEARRVSSTVPY